MYMLSRGRCVLASSRWSVVQRGRLLLLTLLFDILWNRRLHAFLRRRRRSMTVMLQLFRRCRRILLLCLLNGLTLYSSLRPTVVTTATRIHLKVSEFGA
jgi:hypothetical protein